MTLWHFSKDGKRQFNKYSENSFSTILISSGSHVLLLTVPIGEAEIKAIKKLYYYFSFNWNWIESVPTQDKCAKFQLNVLKTKS